MRDLSSGKVAALCMFGFILNAATCYSSYSVTQRNAENYGPLSILFGFLAGMTVSGIAVGTATLLFRYCKILTICQKISVLESDARVDLDLDAKKAIKKKVYLSTIKLNFVTTLITSTITAGLAYKPPFQDSYYVGGVIGFITLIAYLVRIAGKNDPVYEFLRRKTQAPEQNSEMSVPLTQSSSQVTLTA